MPALVEALPASTPIVLFAPRLSVALSDATSMLTWLSTVEPALAVSDPAAPDAQNEVRRTTLDLVASLWRGPNVSTDDGAVRSLDDLARIGIDADAPIAIVPDRGGEVAVVILGLSSRKRFEQWLSAIEGPERAHVKIGGEQASVIAATSDAPVVCLARQGHAYCQIGRVDPKAPTGPLKRLLEFDGPTIAKAKDRVEAFAALPPGAHFYATIFPKGLAAVVGERRLEEARAKARFLDKAQAAAHLRQVRLGHGRFDHYASYVPGAAFGVYPDADGVRLEAQLVLNAAGRRMVAHAVPDAPPDEMIARWSRTPSLFGMLLRTHPDVMRSWAHEEGVDLPPGALTGTLALLTLGVDSECPSAKHRAAIRPQRWAFLMPSAAAVGLTTVEHANAVHGALAKRFELAPREAEQRPLDRPALAGNAFGSPFQVEVLDDMVLVGTGRGSGAAALRRLGALPPSTPRDEGPVPFLEMQLDLRAVDAAFAAGAFGSEHREELLALEALRWKLKPLLSTIDQVSVSAVKHDAGGRVALIGRLGR